MVTMLYSVKAVEHISVELINSPTSTCTETQATFLSDTARPISTILLNSIVI